jgi:hypothetical protein
MAAASGPARPGSERAETYLRLQAEAELRLALAMPQYKRARQSRRDRRNVIIMSRQRTAARRVMRFRSGRARGQGGQVMAGREGAVLRRLAGWAGQVLAAVGSRATSRMWRVRSRLRRSYGRSRPVPQAQECLERVAELAAALVGAGAIDEATEAAVYADLRMSLAARNRIDQDELLDDHWYTGPPTAGASPSAAGPIRAIPVGVVAQREIDGQSLRVYIGAFVADQNSAALTMHARFPPALLEGGAGRRHPLLAALQACTATDDGRQNYQADFSGGGGDGEWDCVFELHPVPPAGCRWLDFALPGADPVRVPLDSAPPAYPVTTARLAPEEVADRYVDGQTLDLLQAWWGEDGQGDSDAAGDDDSDGPGLLRIAASLLAAGVLTADSPSLARLAAAAGRLGLKLPAELSVVKPGSLPADWLSLLARSGSDDGPAGVVPVAAVLPAVDGARCVLTELVSEPDSATLRARASGWPEPFHRWRQPTESFRWTARDNVHGWYVGSEGGGSYSDGVADVEIRLYPAINPRASELQITLTGRSGEASVTVPLVWQEGL